MGRHESIELLRWFAVRLCPLQYKLDAKMYKPGSFPDLLLKIMAFPKTLMTARWFGLSQSSVIGRNFCMLSEGVEYWTVRNKVNYISINP